MSYNNHERETFNSWLLLVGTIMLTLAIFGEREITIHLMTDSKVPILYYNNDFFIFLSIYILCVSLYFAYLKYQESKLNITFIFIVIGIIFNPFFTFDFSINFGNILKLATAIFFGYFCYQEYKKLTVNSAKEIAESKRLDQNIIEKPKEVTSTISNDIYNTEEKGIKKKRKWGWIIISFVIFSSFKNIGFKNGDLFIGMFLLISLVLAPLFYYWIKPKIKIIRDGGIKSFVIGLMVIIIFCFAIGFFGSLSDVIVLKIPVKSN